MKVINPKSANFLFEDALEGLRIKNSINFWIKDTFLHKLSLAAFPPTIRPRNFFPPDLLLSAFPLRSKGPWRLVWQIVWLSKSAWVSHIDSNKRFLNTKYANVRLASLVVGSKFGLRKFNSGVWTPGNGTCSVDLSYPVRFCYLPLKQWVVQFDNEKCYLLDCVLLTSTPTQTPKLTPYCNADTFNIVVQREKKDSTLMCACAVSRVKKIWRLG